jgi:hypothetical protein
MWQRLRAHPAVRWLALSVGLVAVVVAGVLAGFAAGGAGHPGQAHPRAGVLAVPGQSIPPAPHYPRNAKGLTYGSMQSAATDQQAPALILVTDTQGENGYVFKTDLDAATGATISSPDQALAWQAKQDAMAAAGQTTSIPVYRSDGVSKIGVFVIQPGVAK